MKTSEIRKMSTEEILKKIEELKSELFDLKMKQSTGSLEKSSRVRELRKNVARMNTILSERKIENGGEE